MDAFRKSTGLVPLPTVTGTVTSTPFPSIPTASASASATPIPLPPIIEYEKVEDLGKTVLWVVFVIMLVSTVVFSFLAYRTPVQQRLFHVLTAFITTFATLSYFAMATGDGNYFAHIVIPSQSPVVKDEIFRQVFWARYVDWAVTTPLLLLDLSLLAGLNGANILVAVVADVIMVLFGLFAAFGNEGGQKWGYYTFACIAYLVVVYQLVIPGRRAVYSKDASTKKLYAGIGLFTLVLWTLYPIVWAIGDGSRIWSVDAEIVAYAVLDVLAKPAFGFWLLLARRGQQATLDGFWSQGLGHEGTIRIDDDEA